MNREELEHYIKYFNNQKGNPYPCGNQIVICAVITKDKDKALSVMEKKGAIIKWQTRDNIEWELNNERWLWKRWNENARGYRFYKILVDENVDEDLFRWVRIHSGFYCCSVEII